MSEQEKIREIVLKEYAKCAQDPAYFMRKYCYIQHPTRGRILFNLYPFQEKVLHIFRDHQYLITLKSRQLGISTLAAGYSLWLMLFHKDKNVLALATTQATARNLVTKVQFMYEQLPSWLRLKAVEKNKLSSIISHIKLSRPYLRKAFGNGALAFLLVAYHQCLYSLFLIEPLHLPI